MSAIGMLGASVMESIMSKNNQGGSQNFMREFQQLGRDLQSGNISQAQSDLAGLQTSVSSGQPSGSSPAIGPQAFSQLAQDLQSGNLTAAQSDYATLRQNLQQNTNYPHHHHAHGPDLNSALTQMQQSFSQLGQALQSGNLSAAQQAYTALQTDATAFVPYGNNASSSSSSSAGTSVNITA